jgi:soluble lytic murein transglycosylase
MRIFGWKKRSLSLLLLLGLVGACAPLREAPTAVDRTPSPQTKDSTREGGAAAGPSSGDAASSEVAPASNAAGSSADGGLAGADLASTEPAPTSEAKTVLEARSAVDAGDPARARRILVDLASRRGAGAQAPNNFDRSGASDDSKNSEDKAEEPGQPKPASDGNAASESASQAVASAEAVAPGPTRFPLSVILDALPPAGLYVYGLALESEGLDGPAAEAFARYGEAEPALADVAAMAVGNARFAEGRHALAATAFEQARDGAGDPGSAFLATLRLGNARLRTGQVAAALAAYRDAEDRATDDSGRAQALAGQIASQLASEDVATAMESRRRLLREYPASPFAAAALARLKTAGETVSADDEAEVIAGQGDTWAALTLLDAAINDGIDGTPAEWLLLRARWYDEVGESDRVVALAEDFLRQHADNPLAPEMAWLRARALQRLDRGTAAAEGYLMLAEGWPGHGRASEALWRRAWLLAHIDSPAQAMAAFDLLAARYPDDSQAPEARFQAGLFALGGGDAAEAGRRWNAIAAVGSASERARAAYWLGRLARDAGDVDGASSHWRQAAELDPTAFYGLRARARLEDSAELLAAPVDSSAAAGAGARAASEPSAASGTSTASEAFGTAGTAGTFADAGSDPSVASAAMDIELAAWLAGWSEQADPAQARAALEGGRELPRARAWLAIGERTAALRDLRRAIGKQEGDPARLALLASEANALELQEVAIASATSAILRAPASARLAAPLSLARLAYPLPFSDDLLAEARARALPATLLAALVRQESRFEPSARSSAGALGLTQVMPETGRQIAGWLGVSGFSPEDLYEPAMALRFGAAYLGRQLDRFDGRAWPALAAYNGGPGNADRWWEASGGDLDRFAEGIDFTETRRYVKLVAEHEAHYRRLWPDLSGAGAPGH